MTTLLLARHGETDWNRDGRWQGHADRPLNEVGRRQADELARSLADEPIDAIYSSDLRRARQTAAAVAGRLGLVVHETPRLREVDVGEFSGLTWDEILERWPDVPERIERLGYGWRDGESLEQMAERVLDAVRDIAGSHPGGHVLVVGHGGMIRALLAAADEIDIVGHRRLVGPAEHCAVHRVAVGSGGLRRVD